LASINENISASSATSKCLGRYMISLWANFEGQLSTKIYLLAS
jgi:hypothetical protein